SWQPASLDDPARIEVLKAILNTIATVDPTRYAQLLCGPPSVRRDICAFRDPRHRDDASLAPFGWQRHTLHNFIECGVLVGLRRSCRSPLADQSGLMELHENKIFLKNATLQPGAGYEVLEILFKPGRVIDPDRGSPYALNCEAA